MTGDDHRDEALLDELSQPIELDHLRVSASGALHLNREWVAYLDAVQLPTTVAGVDDRLHHGGPDGGTAYA